VSAEEVTVRANWAGNYAYRAREIVAPRSVEEVQELVSRSSRIGFLGSRHSFNEIADSDVLIVLSGLPEICEIDLAAATVTAGAGMTYGALALALARDGMALANLASLPHISIAGAVSTGTHGSGDANGNLATSVAALELIRADGELVAVRRGDPDFDGCVVSLGALGAIVRVTLDIQPAYEVRQRVWEEVPLQAILERFDDVMSLGYSVSLMTLWEATLYLVWIKTRVQPGETEPVLELPGGRPAAHDMHPIPGLDPINCTPQMGVPGPWFERLPHFRMGFTPSNGNELQSEFLIDRRHAREALAAVSALGDLIRPVLQICEIRTILADELWLSPEYRRDTVAFHFTWQPDQARVEAALRVLEAALAPLHPRPHWGKVFVGEQMSMYELYPRLTDFVALAHRYDPRGAFRNPWLERFVFGSDL
jgi:xylitol oxidase